MADRQQRHEVMRGVIPCGYRQKGQHHRAGREPLAPDDLPRPDDRPDRGHGQHPDDDQAQRVFHHHRRAARGFQWVDPLKEMNASVVGLQNGLLSMQDIANQQGRDVEEIFDQIQAEKEMAARYGLTMAFQPFGNKAPIPADIASDQQGVA